MPGQRENRAMANDEEGEKRWGWCATRGGGGRAIRGRMCVRTKGDAMGVGCREVRGGVDDGVVLPSSGGGVCGCPSRHLIVVNMGVKEDVDLWFGGDFGVIGVEAGAE